MKILHINFREGHTAIDNVSFSVEEGKLIGIMGASGSGKTTLLNLMSGIQKPTSGSVKINGLDVFRDKKDLEGVFGYVPQDDLLIEDLTVFENLILLPVSVSKTKREKRLLHLLIRHFQTLDYLKRENLKLVLLLIR